MKNFLLFLTTLIVSVSLVACGYNETLDHNQNNTTLDDKAEQVDIPEDKSDAITDYFSKVEVKYVGQVDNHTIEVIKDRDYVSFQLDQTIDFDLSAIEKGSTIFIDYVIERIPVEDGEVVSSYIIDINEYEAGMSDTTRETVLPIKEDLDKQRETKDITVLVEGMEEKRKAYRYLGANTQFEVFLLEGFNLITEGETVEKIISSEHPEYFAEIRVLDRYFALDELEAELKTELEEFVELQTPSNGIMSGFYDDSLIYLVASKGELNSENRFISKLYLVKEFDDRKFLIKINLPVTELSEGMEPSFVAMLKTLK